MELLMKKSMTDLMNISMERLRQTQLNEISRGGVARLFLAVINENIAGFYETLQLNHIQAFLSTATGAGLDELGYVLACTRLESETDETYRARISNQVLSAQAANETAIRLAVLSVIEVQDVVMKKYTMGTGSFSIFVVTDNPNTEGPILDSIVTAVNSVVGYGIKFDVSAANYIPVEIQLKLLFKSTVGIVDQASIKNKVVNAMKGYLNSRAIGEQIIINEITQRVMEISEDIVNYQLPLLKVNGKRVLNKDQSCKWNERFCESPIPNAIIVT